MSLRYYMVTEKGLRRIPPRVLNKPEPIPRYANQRLKIIQALYSRIASKLLLEISGSFCGFDENGYAHVSEDDLRVQKPRLPVNRAKVAHQKAPVIRTESTFSYGTGGRQFRGGPCRGFSWWPWHAVALAEGTEPVGGVTRSPTTPVRRMCLPHSLRGVGIEKAPQEGSGCVLAGDRPGQALRGAKRTGEGFSSGLRCW
jgi:hypothetical protein